MRRTFVLLVVLVLFGIGQVVSSQGPSELERERLIRIVEPAIFPLVDLTRRTHSFEVLWDYCKGPGVFETELGQAWFRCKEDPPISLMIHGPNPTDPTFGDRTYEITVRGFNTHDRLCWLSSDGPGTSDERQYCDEKKSGRVKAVVVGRFTLVTKWLKYNKQEADEVTELRRSFFGDSLGPGGPVKEGDTKGREVTVSPVRYEFLNGK